MRKALLLHPLLFAAFPVLFLFAQNVRESARASLLAFDRLS